MGKFPGIPVLHGHWGTISVQGVDLCRGMLQEAFAEDDHCNWNKKIHEQHKNPESHGRFPFCRNRKDGLRAVFPDRFPKKAASAGKIAGFSVCTVGLGGSLYGKKGWFFFLYRSFPLSSTGRKRIFSILTVVMIHSLRVK